MTMQLTTLALGSMIVLFALYTAISSIKKPTELIRLKYMQSKLGKRMGFALHTIVYVVVPLIFAYFMIRAGINGETITQFITQ